MNSVSPVLTSAEVPVEQVIALDQPQYLPIIVARTWFTGGAPMTGSPASFTRYRLSPAERALVAAGADLILGQPHHGLMMPVSLQLAMPGEYPESNQ
jgi:hypothetical protein